MTPNQNAIKALLNGWRAVGNSSTAYNSWVSILDGSAPPTNTEAYVAANKAPGWTAYATLQYQLVNPVTSTARIEGAISLHSGVNALEMREAAMLREKVTPVLDSASGVYRLNFTTLPASVFKRPAETILAIYKGTDIDRKWTILANATLAKGITRAHIPFADYDLSADYFSSYIALDRYAYSAAISAATAFYAGNLGSAVSANTQQLARETLRNDIQDWIQVVDDARLIDLRLDVNAINNAFLRKLGGYRFEKVLGVVAFTASTNNQKADIYYSPDSGGHIAYLEIEVTGNWNGINAIGRVVKTIAIASSTFGNISSQFARYTVADGKAGDYISISDVVFDTTNNRYRIRLATTNTGYANGFVVTVRGVIPSKTDPVINSLALSPVFTTDTTAFVPAKVQILSSEILEDENHRFVTDYERIKLDGIQEFANHYEHPTGDGNLHVPSTGTANNGKVLKAGSTPGSASWQQIAANEISQDASNRLVTDAEKSTWNGKASTAVATTVFDGLMSSSDKQLSNNRNGYGTTAGTGTAYTLTLSPVPTLVEGLRVTVKFHTANGANPTLNVNSNSNRSILKPNGSAPAAGQLKANSVYTLVYNGTDFILQGDGGDYSIGEQILATSLQIVDYTGAELWSKTDVANGCGITVDGAGNVYCAHVVSGKSIRKLDSSGAEIWSKTDVSTGYDVAVDSAGNVYCAHAVGTGSKSIRKLDSSGAEIWSKTDISGGSGVVVDNAGNVYCAHYVGSEIKSIRKLNSSGAEIWSKTDMPFANRVALDNAGNVYGAFATSAGNKSIRKLNSSGSEIWSKTDVSNGNDVTVDSAGNVYCAHSASGGSKSIRKLDSSGAEIWSKTDVSNGYGVTLDSAGNVYCAHYTSGDKSIRKLDSSGAEIWSKTDVMYGRDVAVDSAGNVYCAHDVNSGSKSIRKLREAVLSYKILN
ncbi:hypothetical protein JFN88_12495 [Paenibacillus sp. MAHUQ-46]|uniref:Uncharacterized protein n=1 Tax=Paenibacillus roseus TaxID=2798579 RepID=A0A934IZH3_9BACL|nr:hypothetical protein [Paenibacillus roseus]